MDNVSPKKANTIATIATNVANTALINCYRKKARDCYI